TNLVGAIKAALRRPDRRVMFGEIERRWSPKRPVSTYLSTRSRTKAPGAKRTDWVSLMAYRWNGENGPYSPAYFDGVVWKGEVDRRGFRVFDATELAEALR